MTVFSAKRVSRVQSLQLNDVIEKAFPLFEPINEKKWAYGWELELIYPKTEVIAEGLVFKTKGHATDEKIWTLTKLDKEQFQIEYLNIEHKFLLGNILINCEENSDSTTTAVVTYIYTALSEKGNNYIDTFTAEFFKNWLDSWEKSINYYLDTGTILEEPH